MTQKHKKKHHGGASGAKEAQAALDRGRTLLAAGDAEKAVAELARAWSGQKSDAARDALLTATRAAAPSLVCARPAAAVDMLTRALSLASSDDELARWLAAAHWACGQPESAGRIVGALMERRPAEPRHRLALALVRARQGVGPTAAKLALDASKTVSGHRPPTEEEQAEITEVRDLVRLALAALSPDEGALAALSAEGVSDEERAALVFSLTARQEAAVEWYTGAAGKALTEALATERARWEAGLSATVATPPAPVPDVRELLAVLADALSERLREASVPRAAKRPRGWVALTAHCVRDLRAGHDGEATERAKAAVADAPRAIGLVLEAATLAPREGFERLVAESARLPRRALERLAEALLARLDHEHLTEELAARLAERLPRLASQVHSVLAFKALTARQYEVAARLFAGLPEPRPIERGMLAVALENMKRHEDALGIWRELVKKALDGGQLPPYAVTGLERLIANNRPDDDRLVRAGLSALPERDDLWLYHVSALTMRGGARYEQAAHDVLTAYRPARPQFVAARAIELLRLGAGTDVLRDLADRTSGGRPVPEADRVRHALETAGPYLAIDMAIAIQMKGSAPDALKLLRDIPPGELARLPAFTAITILGELWVDPSCIGFEARLDAVLGARPTPDEKTEVLLVLLDRLLDEYERWGEVRLLELSRRLRQLDGETPVVRNALRTLEARVFRPPEPVSGTFTHKDDFEGALRILSERARQISRKLEADDDAAQLANRRALLAETGTHAAPLDEPLPDIITAVTDALVSIAAHRTGLELE